MLINGYWGENEDGTDIITDSCGHIYTFYGREINRPKGRPNYLLLYIHRGAVRFFLHGRELQAKSGDFILYAPGEEQHHIYESIRSGEFYYLHFTTENPAYLEALGMQTSVLYHSQSSADTADIFERIIRELQLQREDYRRACRSLAMYLFISVRRQIFDEKEEQRDPELFAVIQYIRKHYDENTDLERYAEMCEMSKYHFSRLFKKQTGMSPLEYRTSVRLEHAKELLLHTRYSVKHIAEQIGYSSPEYFSGAFKKQTGLSPAAFRVNANKNKETTMKKYHLFDFDGTLGDSMPVWAGTMLKILDAAGISYPDDVVRIITPLGYGGTADYFISLGIKTPREKLIEQMYAMAEDAYTNVIILKPGVADYVQRLTDAGCSCNVLTASPHWLIDPCLKRNGLYDCFDKIWTIEDFDMTKDQPEIYLEAARRLGCSVDEVCFYDDNLVALQTAKKAGMMVVGVRDPFSDPYRAEIEALTDAYFETFEEKIPQ